MFTKSPTPYPQSLLISGSYIEYPGYTTQIVPKEGNQLPRSLKSFMQVKLYFLYIETFVSSA